MQVDAKMFWYRFIGGLLTASCMQIAHADISGAGASFPAPVIEAWAKQYTQESKIEVEYRSVGSAEGIRRVTARGADFGVTDVPLTQAELSQDDLLQFPLVAGGIVPVVNLPGVNVTELKLTGNVLAEIYLGKINHWNDPALRELNPGLALPDLAIKVAHRADGSGSSFVFTHYLSKTNPEWQQRYGIASRMQWPVGSAATGNSGVAEFVKDNAGAIGYVEFSYAQSYGLTGVSLRNKAGRFITPDLAAFHAALASFNWTRRSYYEVLTDANGDDSWPIVGVSFVLMHKRQQNAADAVGMLKFFDWIHHSGTTLAEQNRYLTLDNRNLAARIEASWGEVKDEHNASVWKGK